MYRWAGLNHRWAQHAFPSRNSTRRSRGPRKRSLWQTLQIKKKEKENKSQRIFGSWCVSFNSTPFPAATRVSPPLSSPPPPRRLARVFASPSAAAAAARRGGGGRAPSRRASHVAAPERAGGGAAEPLQGGGGRRGGEAAARGQHGGDPQEPARGEPPEEAPRRPPRRRRGRRGGVPAARPLLRAPAEGLYMSRSGPVFWFGGRALDLAVPDLVF